MKVIHTLFAYDSGRFRGGVTKAVADLTAAQASIGLDVEIWAPHEGRDMLVTSHDGVTVRQFPGRRLAGMTWSPALGTGLQHLPQQTVLHSHSIFDVVNWQTARAARRTGSPLFAHCHGAVAPELISTSDARAVKKRAYSRLVEIPNLNTARAVFALTDVERREIEACRVRSEIQVVPNGVVLPDLSEAPGTRDLRAELGIAPSDFVVLYLGRIHPKKRIEDIIDACIGASARDPRIHLLIAGSATTEQRYYRELLARGSALQQQGRLHWIGHVGEADKPAVFRAADLFVHASFSEGMALAILEAMSYGKCVIATPGCNMATAAAHGALQEVPATVEDLTRELLSLARDDARREGIGTQARGYVTERHDWKAISRRMADVYEHALREAA